MFHGNRSLPRVYLTFHSYKYELGGPTTKQWHTKRHKGSCRGIEFSLDGSHLVSVGKDTVIKMADSETGKVVVKDMEAHSYDQNWKELIIREAINAVKYVNENIFVTGDDIGVVKVHICVTRLMRGMGYTNFETHSDVSRNTYRSYHFIPSSFD